MTIPRQPDITALQWRKSSHSGSGNNCVEVASMAAAVAVRDSKDPDGGHLVFDGSTQELVGSKDPFIQEYLS